MVSAFPDSDNISAAYKGAVDEVRELYDGMTDYEKKFVDSDALSTFETLEVRVNELYNAQEAAKQETESTETE
jgi:flagellar basal-body rod modification protein FlgD